MEAALVFVVFSPGKQMHNVLHTVEHYTQSEGVFPSGKHQEGLCRTRSENSRIPDLQAAALRTTNILTPQQYFEQEKQGLIPRLKNHDMMLYLAEVMHDITTQVISM